MLQHASRYSGGMKIHFPTGVNDLLNIFQGNNQPFFASFSFRFVSPDHATIKFLSKTKTINSSHNVAVPKFAEDRLLGEISC